MFNYDLIINYFDTHIAFYFEQFVIQLTKIDDTTRIVFIYFIHLYKEDRRFSDGTSTMVVNNYNQQMFVFFGRNLPKVIKCKYEDLESIEEFPKDAIGLFIS